MSNIFTDETRNEDHHKRFSVLTINSLTLETFYHFDVQGMSGSVDVFYGPNEAGKTSLMEVIPWIIAAQNVTKHDTRDLSDTSFRNLIDVFKRENFLKVDQLHELSILEDLKLSEALFRQAQKKMRKQNRKK